jgi:hypothetical protein
LQFVELKKAFDRVRLADVIDWEKEKSLDK